MTRPPETAVFALLLLGNDFLALSFLLSGGERGNFAWVFVGVFGVTLLWFIIRGEPHWKKACLLLAGAISFFGLPAGMAALWLCDPGRGASPMKEGGDAGQPPVMTESPFKKYFRPRRLLVNALYKDHAKIINNPR